MDVYEISAKVQVVEWYCQGNAFRGIRKLFIEIYINRPSPSCSTLYRVANSFEIRGCIAT